MHRLPNTDPRLDSQKHIFYIVENVQFHANFASRIHRLEKFEVMHPEDRSFSEGARDGFDDQARNEGTLDWGPLKAYLSCILVIVMQLSPVIKSRAEMVHELPIDEVIVSYTLIFLQHLTGLPLNHPIECRLNLLQEAKSRYSFGFIDEIACWFDAIKICVQGQQEIALPIKRAPPPGDMFIAN